MDIWIGFAEWGSRIILLFLVGLSVWSIMIILKKRQYFKDIRREDFNKYFTDDLDILKKSNSEDKKVLLAPHYLNIQHELTKGHSVLGTLGSTTPFIGLLGTILGIIVAFGKLSSGVMNTNGIMFALAEALILTAVGLIVAIPAVVSFNYYNKKSKDLLDLIKVNIEKDIISKV